MIFVCCLLLLSVGAGQASAANCHCRETDRAVEVTSPEGAHLLFCGWEDKAIAPEVSPPPLVMTSIRDCRGDSLLWSNELDDVTPYQVEERGSGLTLTRGLIFELDTNGVRSFIALKQFNLDAQGAGYTFDSVYVYEPPRFAGERLTRLLESCRLVAGEIREGRHSNFPGDANDLREIFLGAIADVRSARWLFTSLSQHFLLEGSVAQSYKRYARLYDYINRHEQFEQADGQ